MYRTSRVVNKKIVYDEKVLASLKLRVYDENNWQTSVMAYEKPFVGMAPISISYNGQAKVPQISDKSLVNGSTTIFDGKSIEMRLRDPYWYIAYLSNVVFAGGYEIDTKRFNCYTTTSQSVVYTDKGGKYEGKLSTLNSGWNCYNDYLKVRKLSWYEYDDYNSITPYPLPYYADHTYNYVRGGNKRLAYYYPSATVKNRFTNLINDLKDVYLLCDDFQTAIENKASEVQKAYDAAVTPTGGIGNVENWNNKYIGCYITKVRNGKRLEVPYYQIPLIWGGTWDHGITCNMYNTLPTLVNNHVNPNSTHNRAETAYGNPLYYRLYGGSGYSKDAFDFSGYMRKIISRVKVKTYRVNAYDVNTGRYSAVPSINDAGQNYCGTVEEGYTLDDPLMNTYTVKDINGNKEVK